MFPQPIKDLLRRFQPAVIRDLRSQRTISRYHRTFSPLTIEEVFSKTYAENIWGGKAGEFYSGRGSGDRFTDRYCELIRNFIINHNLRTVVDIGCGDFRVGQKICSSSISYVGIDIVSSLVDHLNRTFGSETTVFRSINVVEQTPPDGDLCLIREVLQHLSNREVEQLLGNVRKYPYVIVTEHVPVFPVKYNLDKPHGPDIRLSTQSGVFLDQPPFSLQTETLLEVPVGSNDLIRTVLIRNRRQMSLDV